MGTEFRKLIEQHLDAGTCYLCGKPVVELQAVHGLTGAHWDCHEAAERKGEEALRKLDANLARGFELLEQIRKATR